MARRGIRSYGWGNESWYRKANPSGAMGAIKYSEVLGGMNMKSGIQKALMIERTSLERSGEGEESWA